MHINVSYVCGNTDSVAESLYFVLLHCNRVQIVQIVLLSEGDHT